MANGKIILKPYSGDSGNQHLGYPENTEIYRWISEDVSDGDVDYIYAPAPTENAQVRQELLSLFYLNGAIPQNRIKVSSIKIKYSARETVVCEYSSTIRFTLISGAIARQTEAKDVSEYLSEPEEIALPAEDVQNLNEWLAVANKGAFPEFSIFVYTVNGCNVESSKGSLENITTYHYAEVRLSQLYIEIDYEEILDIGIHRQVNGAVKAAVAAYRKLGGSWAEITEEEAKDILKNNIITQGGS